jgi:V/A-type H+/Na+-transporting ATPase subunit I
MIVKMINYSMLLYHHDKDVFMEKLMDLGLVHIKGYQTTDDSTTQQLSYLIKETHDTIKRFKRRNKKSNGNNIIPSYTLPALEYIVEREQELEKNQHEAEALTIEIKLLEPWGNFNWDTIRKLEERTSVEVLFFQYPENRFKEEWKKDFTLQVINIVNGIVYFIIFRKDQEELPLSPVALPWTSLDSLKIQREECLEKITTLDALLNSYAIHFSTGLQNRLEEAKDQLSLHLAQKQAVASVDNLIWIMEAWCPVPSEKKLLAFLDAEQIVYVKTEPQKAEKPPVLLRNNAFTKLFEPIGAMFSLPAYSELDLTVFFAPFFLLFFGLCLGDVGYGIILVTITIVLSYRPATVIHPFIPLIRLFGISTILAGLLSGTFFGIEMAHHKAFSAFSALYLSQDQLFNLALIIGFIQILFGMVIQVYKRWIFQGFRFALSRIGWILLLLGLADSYVTEWLTPISGYLIWPALALIIFFGAPEKGWLASFGLGLADLYNLTGVLGDLLSYIRLFALGVSSAILGLVVNSIALSAKDVPYAGFFLFALILVVGHTTNLLLSSLSAFVHPMRLTFVEFYKNSGFEGGGTPFLPFARHAKKNKLSP